MVIRAQGSPPQSVFDASAVTATRVGLLLIDGFALLSYASVVEPLRVANLLSEAEHYQLRVIPVSGAAATSSSGAVIPAAAQVGENVDFDIVFVIAAGNPFAFDDDRVLQWLRHLARRGVTLGGVSGGAVVLAAADVLNGYRMTLHWEHAAALAERQPSLIIERSLYVIDRDRVTCAGGTAPLDLMHALLLRAHGGMLARQVSDWLQHTEIRPPGSAQRAGIVERYGVHQPALIESLAAMESHLSDPLSLEDLAKVSGVGVRQLTRLFEQHLACSPMVFYRRLRLQQGQLLLRQSGLSVAAIATAVGYSTPSHFASAYRKQFSCSPAEER